MAERVVFNNQAAQHIQAYLDYNNIVGNADGGKMMSEKEFEAYKKQIALKAKDRIYSSWRNGKGLDCKSMGPSSMCFCGHRFKDHEYQAPKNKKVNCREPKCSCPCFNHIPVFGSSDIKCLCKHSYTEHDPVTKKCTKGQCGCNQRFQSTFTCSCGSKYGDHQTIIETREERIAQGKPVDSNPNGPYMPGGMNSFQSLVDGADGYEAYVDQLGGGQLALGPYQQQKQLLEGGDVKKNKLMSLNNKIQQEKHINNYERQEDPQQQGQLQLQQAQQRSLLQLFQTPHIYSNASIPARKQLKHH